MTAALKNIFIIWSIFATQLASSTEPTAANLNQIISSKQSILNFTKKASLARYEELNKFMISEKVSDSFKFPQLKNQSGKYEFTLAGATVYFETISETQILIKSNEKSVKVDSSMSLNTIKKTVETLFQETQKATFFNYIINNAQAQLLIGETLAVAAIVSSLVAFVMFVNYSMSKSYSESQKNKKLDELVKSSKDVCGQLEAAQEEVVLSDKLLEAYNSLSKNYSAICSAMEKANNSRKIVCLEAQIVKKCLKDSINKVSQINNSKRSDVKKIYYNATEDVYTPNAISK